MMYLASGLVLGDFSFYAVLMLKKTVVSEMDGLQTTEKVSDIQPGSLLTVSQRNSNRMLPSRAQEDTDGR